MALWLKFMIENSMKLKWISVAAYINFEVEFLWFK